MKNKLKVFNNLLYLFSSVVLVTTFIITSQVIDTAIYNFDIINNFIILDICKFYIVAMLFSLIIYMYEYFSDNKIFMDKKYNILMVGYNIIILIKLILMVILLNSKSISLITRKCEFEYLILLTLLILIYNLLNKDKIKEPLKDKVVRLLKVLNNLVIITFVFVGLVFVIDKLNLGTIVSAIFYAIMLLMILINFIFKEVTLSKKHNKKIAMANILVIIGILFYLVLENISPILFLVLFGIFVVFVMYVIVLLLIDVKDYIKVFTKKRIKTLLNLFVLIIPFLLFVLCYLYPLFNSF